jgi:hypothetical protein
VSWVAGRKTKAANFAAKFPKDEVLNVHAGALREAQVAAVRAFLFL